MREELLRLAAEAELRCEARFREIDRVAFHNTKRVLDAFRRYRVSEASLGTTTGYGYDDNGRETLDRIYAELLGTEAALVRIGFVNGTHALNGVSFQVDDGDFAFLVGPSGSGKSTIIKLLTGEIVPDRGRVMVNGFSVSNIREWQIPLMRRTVGVIFQDFRLIQNKTVYDNLALAMRAVGASKVTVQERIPYVQEKSFPDELSGGEQQRVTIARALVNNPITIVADEPTGNLDPAMSLEIMTLLERINALGTTVIVVTHERELVNHFRKRVILLDHGTVVGDGVGTYEVEA